MSARIIMMAASALALAASGRDLALRNVYSDRMLFQRDQPVVLRSGAAAERTFALDDGCGILRWASARQVAPDRIRVESAAAKDPTRVDYGRAPYIAEAAVFNRDGYPLQPFWRTLFPSGNICH